MKLSLKLIKKDKMKRIERLRRGIPTVHTEKSLFLEKLRQRLGYSSKEQAKAFYNAFIDTLLEALTLDVTNGVTNKSVYLPRLGMMHTTYTKYPKSKAISPKNNAEIKFSTVARIVMTDKTKKIIRGEK